VGDSENRIAIYGEDMVLFRDRIGFIAEFKQGRLRKFIRVQSRANKVVPVNPARVREDIPILPETKSDRRNAINRRRISRRVAAKWGLVDSLSFHHDHIVSITRSIGPAMCVEVPGHGRFVQNGFDGCNSKGLEFPNVFLCGVSEGILPHIRSESMEEERRLFYVGVTRARDLLHISSIMEFAVGTRTVSAEPSRFLGEAGVELEVADEIDDDDDDEDEDDDDDDVGHYVDEHSY